MNDKTEFGSKEAVSLMIIILLTKFVFTTPLELMESAGVSAWISVLFSSVISFFCMHICIYWMTGKKDVCFFDFYQRKSFLWVGLLSSVYFYILTASFIGQYIIGAMHTSLPESPSLYISLFCLACVLAVGFLGLEPSVRSARFFVILLLLIIALLYFVFFEKFDSVAFAPYFGKGYKETFMKAPWKTWIYPEYFFLFYILPFLKRKKYMQHTNLATIVIFSLCALAIVGIYILFIPKEIAQLLNFPTHQMIYFLEGSVSQSVKPLYTFIWHISVFLYAGIVILFSSEMLCRILRTESRKPLVPVLSVGLIYLSFLMGDEARLQDMMKLLLGFGWLLFPVVPLCLSAYAFFGGGKCLKK